MIVQTFAESLQMFFAVFVNLLVLPLCMELIQMLLFTKPSFPTSNKLWTNINLMKQVSANAFDKIPFIYRLYIYL